MILYVFILMIIDILILFMNFIPNLIDYSFKILHFNFLIISLHHVQ
jgi:hypothetical protein